MQPTSRDCRKCGQHKPFSEFSRAPRGKYGLKARCKACDAALSAAKQVRSTLPRKRPRRSPISLDATKRCNGCDAVKPISEFSLSKRATDSTNAVYRSKCKQCQATDARRWYDENTERANENRRRHNLEKTYGISVAGYDALRLQQAGVCAICGKDEPNEHGRNGSKFRLSVDHCHTTGVVRGLLCQRCNRAIGLLDDDPVLLRKAISYLLRARKGAVRQGGQ